MYRPFNIIWHFYCLLKVLSRRTGFTCGFNNIWNFILYLIIVCFSLYRLKLHHPQLASENEELCTNNEQVMYWLLHSAKQQWNRAELGRSMMSVLFLLRWPCYALCFFSHSRRNNINLKCSYECWQFNGLKSTNYHMPKCNRTSNNS